MTHSRPQKVQSSLFLQLRITAALPTKHQQWPARMAFMESLSRGKEIKAALVKTSSKEGRHKGIQDGR